MFDGVVKEYDLLNHLFIWKLDDVWRRTCAEKCASGKVIVDLCCGTGGLTLQISSRSPSEAFIVGLDFSKVMLGRAISKKKAEKHENNHT